MLPAKDNVLHWQVWRDDISHTVHERERQEGGMIIPIQDMQGLVYSEYINWDNALKFSKTVMIPLIKLNKLTDGRKLLLQEKQKEFDPLISSKIICKNKSPVNNVSYLPSKYG